MGGKSFTKPASRLTTPELDKLTLYCQTQLERFFPRIERLRCITSKSSHGDLDLLCAFGDPEIQIGSSQVGHTSDDSENSEVKGKDGDEGRPAYRRFCDDVSSALGANGWVIAYYGYPIIALQVPFKKLGHSGKEEEAFWQVDVALVHPFSFDSYLITCSYNIVFALLVLAAQALSPSLCFRRDGLVMRHQPFFGQPMIEIPLIADRQDLYKWLGLDLAVWEEGFENYEAIYKWITTNPAGSALEAAWKLVAAGKMDGIEVGYKRFHTRIDGVPEFINWLKTNHANVGDSTNVPDQAMPSSSLNPGSRSSLDSESAQETPLDEVVRDLLESRGKLEMYIKQMEPYRLEVERIVAMHEKKRANRIRAAQDEERGRLRRIEEAALAKLQAENGISELKGAGEVSSQLVS